MDVRTWGHEGVLEREYLALQPLIEQVHPRRQNRLNAAEFVHDVLGEMEREAVNSDEDQSEDAPSGDSTSSEGVYTDVIGAQPEDDEDDEIFSSQPEDWPLFM